MDTQDSLITRKARQHNVAPRGQLGDTVSYAGPVSNQLLNLVAVSVIGGKFEAGFEQSLCDRQAHVADPDKPQPVCFWCDRIHAKSPFRQDPTASLLVVVGSVCGYF